MKQIIAIYTIWQICVVNIRNLSVDKIDSCCQMVTGNVIMNWFYA